MHPTAKMKRFACALAVVSLLAAQAALAGPKVFTATQPEWKAECGSCHIAYPPQLLPASAWQRIMATLDRHFGTDASLEPGGAAAIGAFLESNAAGERTSAGAQDLRISTSAWFQRRHHEVAAATWKRPGIRSAANCAACHRGAGEGDFRERNVVIPR